MIDNGEDRFDCLDCDYRLSIPDGNEKRRGGSMARPPGKNGRTFLLCWRQPLLVLGVVLIWRLVALLGTARLVVRDAAV